MPNINTANDAVVSEKDTVEHTDNKHGNEMPEPVRVTTIHDEKRTEFATDINHVAQLGLMNPVQLEEEVVRRLDTWMLSQLWILYMFNYLNLLFQRRFFHTSREPALLQDDS
jgi:hypothetical protein